MKARIVDFDTNPTIDYSNESIIYNFQANGTLLVTGGNGDNVGYSNGERNYTFGEDYITEEPIPGDEKILLVNVNGNTKWTFGIIDGQMILGNSYIDGPDLFFEKN